MTATQENNLNIIDSYLKFFSDKEIHYPESDKFIKQYQQTGGGYIKLAYCMKNEGATGDTENKENKENKEYYNYLKNMDDYHSFSAFRYMKFEDVDAMKVLDISVDKTNGEPTQKWHLIVSYFGMLPFLFEKGYRERMNYKSITCPELIIWLAEACNLCCVDEIYNNAEKMKKGEISTKEWKNYARYYWEKFDEIVFAKNS